MSEADGMNNALMFSKASDEWSTPLDFFRELDAEFAFDVDAAASSTNNLKARWFGLDHRYQKDALAMEWFPYGRTFWLNPPYSKCREFIAKAAEQAGKGCTVVCLVPSRTDTRWWHDYVWFGSGPLNHVEVRFIKGRLKFGAGKNSAPFPSVVIIFRGAR